MSADNGVYIAEFTEWFKVVHAQAIDNIYYHPVWSAERKEMMDLYFGHAQFISNIDDAMIEAQRLEQIELSDPFCPMVEYGIVNLWRIEI